MSNVVHGPGVTPVKIFSDNLTNIDTNSKKNVRISWGGSVTTKTSIFRDPCFGSFSDEVPEKFHIKIEMLNP